jgi:hypothetical protein
MLKGLALHAPVRQIAYFKVAVGKKQITLSALRNYGGVQGQQNHPKDPLHR